MKRQIMQFLERTYPYADVIVSAVGVASLLFVFALIYLKG